MGEMRIPLKLDARPVKQRPYRLNPKYKEKVKIELDRMLEAGIIELVEESEWISLWWYKIRRQERSVST
jgi:hypothetical protein